jgi:hypothetical protein
MADDFVRQFSAASLNVLTPAAWDLLIRTLDVRLKSVEEKRASFEEAAAQLAQIGLDRINQALLPAFQEVLAIAHLGAIFTATSGTTLQVTTGTKQLTIPEDQRDRFAPAAYVALRAVGHTGIAMTGEVSAYDRPTGTLTVAAEQVIGTGEFNEWVVSPVPAPDFGSYTQSEIDAAIGAVSAELSTLAGTVSNKAANVHTHISTDVTGLSDALAGKAAAAHTHGTDDITGLDAALADHVALTGDETVAGVKTFSSIPVLPASSPTTDNQATRKKYVDNAVAAASASSRTLIASSTPTGVSSVTFTDIPQTYRLLEVVFADVSGTAGYSLVRLAYSPNTGGSPTFRDGLGVYYTAWNGEDSPNFYIGTLGSAASTLSGAVTISGIAARSGRMVFGHIIVSGNGTGVTGGMGRDEAVNALRVSLSSGNFDAGTISLYGIK